MAHYLTGKRRQKRTKMVVPVWLWIAGFDGTQESHLAHTLDVTDHGVMLGGFRGELKVEQTFEIQYRHQKARFGVVWIASRDGSAEKQIGAECQEPEKRIWGI